MVKFTHADRFRSDERVLCFVSDVFFIIILLLVHHIITEYRLYGVQIPMEIFHYYYYYYRV